MKYFWTNTVWYLLLNTVTAYELTYTLIKTKQRKFVFAFYTTISGMVIVIFEQVVYLFTRGYDYDPKVIQTMPLYDNLIGKMSSQLSVSATVLLIAVFDLRFRWILLIAGMYGLVEEWFLALGIYKHHWYRTWMTPPSLIVYFWGAKRYYTWLLKGSIKPIMHYANLFTGMFTLYISSPEPWIFLLAGVQTYVADRLPDQFIYTILMINGVYGLLAAACMLVYFLKLNWPWKAAITMFLIGVIHLAYRKMNLLWFENNGWLLIFTLANLLWVYVTVVWLDRWYKSIRPYGYRLEEADTG